MASPLPHPYICPAYINMRTGERTADDAKLAWLDYAITSGSAYLENQRA